MIAAAMTVRIKDQLDNACKAEVDRSERACRIIPAIVDRMNLPKVGLDGQPLRYSLEVQDRNNPFVSRRLGWDETFEQARVEEGSILLIFAEMIAG